MEHKVNMPLQLLSRPHGRPLPQTELATDLSFVHGRVHELCGPARRSLAVRLAGRLTGPVLWFLPAWQGEKPAAQGLAPWLNPARIVFVAVQREEDMYWGMEEALRSAAVPMVIAETRTPPGLTPIRRLHLAAEAGARPALIVMLTPEDGGAQGVETRWHMAPAHTGADQSSWALTRLRARLAPPRTFTLSQDGNGLCLSNAAAA